jgi:AsmA protein
MKRIHKAMIIAVAVPVVLIVALTVAAKLLITPERVRQTVLPMAETALQRPVELGEIKIGLFSGISLQDLVVREKEGSEIFIAAENLVLRYQFWPLLRLKVVVDEVSLREPRIRVTRLADGSFNFSDLIASRGEAPEPAATEPSAGVPPLDVLISEVSIRGGELLFVDHAAVVGGAPLSHKVSKLDMSASDLSLNRSFPFEVNGLLNEAPLKFKGEIDPVAVGGSGTISLAELDVTAFTPYFKESVPGQLDTLKLSLDLQVSGTAGTLTSSGTATLADLGLALNALPEAPIRKAHLTAEHELSFSKEADRLEIKVVKVDYNGLVVEVFGHLEQLTAGPVADLTVRLPALALKQAMAAVPAGMGPDLASFDPEGGISAEARLVGPLAKTDTLLASAWLELEKVQITAGGLRPSVNGRLELTGDRLTSRDLVLGDGTNQARLELTAGNLFNKPVVVRHKLTAERFLLDPLLAAGSAIDSSGHGKNDSSAKAEPAKEAGPFNLPLTVEGEVKIGETVYKGLAVSNFNLVYNLKNNVLTVTRLDGALAGGSFADTARVELGQSPLAFQTRLDLKGIQAEPFLRAFLPTYADMVTGALDFDVDANGRGTLPDTIKRTLKGKGSVTISNGRFANTPVVQNFAAFLGLEELRELGFTRAGGSFTILDGKLIINSEIKGGDVRLTPAGTVGLDGALDLSLKPSFSPKLTSKLDSKGKFTSFFKDAEGWSELPLKAGGSLTAPRFTLDTAAARQQVEQKVREKVQEEVEKNIQRKLLDRLGPAGQPKQDAAPATPEESKERQLLDDAVRGLFGK